MAAKQGGTVPENNPRLRLALQQAKNANLPKENIERAIKKGNSRNVASYTEATYEGYAMHGVALVVECMTDNINRTVGAVRSFFTKYGGSLGKSGALAFLFDRKGIFCIEKEVTIDEEGLTLAIIEAGAEAIESEAKFFYITCPLETFGQVQQRLEVMQIALYSASLQYIPNTSVTLHQGAASQVIKLIEALEDHDDVQNVSHNMIVSSE